MPDSHDQPAMPGRVWVALDETTGEPRQVATSMFYAPSGRITQAPYVPESVLREAEAARDAMLDKGNPEGAPVLWLRLSEYEAVNLAEGLYTAAYVSDKDDKQPNPLAALNTGDWTLALCWRLQAEIKRHNLRQAPNQTRAEMREHAARIAEMGSATIRAERDALKSRLKDLEDTLDTYWVNNVNKLKENLKEMEAERQKWINHAIHVESTLRKEIDVLRTQLENRNA